MRSLVKFLHLFLSDYWRRHSHPGNACLHLVGVPLVFFGVIQLVAGSLVVGMFLVAFGYFLQYLGHRVQGNEVGEVTLIKHVWQNLRKRFLE